MLKYAYVSSVKLSAYHVVVASPSASAPVVSSSGAFSAATASVVSQSASAAVVTFLGAASVVTQSASSSAVFSSSGAISFKKLVVCYSHLPFAVSTRFLECACATGGGPHEST